LIAYAVTRFRMPFKMLIIGSMLYAYMFPPMLLAIRSTASSSASASRTACSRS
jgi:ABC-type glycerol-3-phosphate transport system permease component